MAYLNGKTTCFSPSLNIEHEYVTAKLIPLEINDLPEGDYTIAPESHESHDGYSSVKAMGAYFNEDDTFYMRTMRIRKNASDYHNCAELEKLIFDRGTQDATVLMGCDDNPKLKEIVFMNSVYIIWENLTFINCPIETLVFESIANASSIAMWGETLVTLTHLKNMHVFKGWDREVVLYESPDLTAESMISIIKNAATVTDGQCLWFGEENILKIPDEFIELALSKGWSLM